MKKLSLLVVLLSLAALADPGKIRLLTATIDPSAPSVNAISEPVCLLSCEGTRLYIIQPETNFTPEEKKAVEALGAKFQGNIPPNAYIVEAGEKELAAVKEKFTLLYAGEFLPEYKLLYVPGGAERVESVGGGEDTYFVQVGAVREEYISAIMQAAEELGVKDAERIYNTLEPCFRAHVTDFQARSLAERGDVAFIEPYALEEIFNDQARTDYSCNVDDMQLEGYTGKDQMVCIQDSGLDNGDLDNIHPDFKNKTVKGRNTAGIAWERGTYDEWYDAGNHGTHVAGSATGTGAASDGQFRGMACDASLFVLCAGLKNGYISSGTEEDLQNTYNQGARVMNNSWGSTGNGYYGSGTRLYDQIIWNNKDYTICFSSGNANRKMDLPTECTLGVTSGAKNIITVGASESYRPEQGDGCYPDDGVHQGVTSFSSRGPCLDGRVKPDLLAPGTGVNSTLASSEHTSVRSKYYTYMGGTSMSSPLVAGCCAVVRDYLQHNRHVASPSAALVKAVLLTGARSLYPGQYTRYQEIPNVRPNNVEGHGHINVKESLEPTDGRMQFKEMTFTRTGQTITNTFEKPAGVDLNVGLVWTDYPGTYGTEKALVNDLDLYVIAPNGSSYTRNDHVDNNEVLRLGDLGAGQYKVIVKAKNIMEANQPCAVVFSYGKGWRVGELSLTKEPFFEWKQTTCDLSLTNLVADSYVTYYAEILTDPEKVFSLDKTKGKFAKGETVKLTADLSKATSARPYCIVKVNAETAGCVVRKISVANGSDEEGYTLYKEDFTQGGFYDLVGEDAALSTTKKTKLEPKTVSPDYFDEVLSEDFEGYEVNESVIGQNGWSVGYGRATNGYAIVRSENRAGVVNKYLQIAYISDLYAPHLRVQGIKQNWTQGHAHGYFKISARVKMSGNSSKTISLFTPDIGENTFQRHGGGYIISTGGKDELGQTYGSQGYLDPNEWTDLEMLIEADAVKVNGANRHALRRVKFAGVTEDCYGIYGSSGNNDNFSVLRFFQWGEGDFCVDDLKVERYVTDIPYEKLAILTNNDTGSSDPNSDGLFAKVGVPIGVQDKFDLQFNVSVAMNDKVSTLVLGQNSNNRQFQSQFTNEGGDFLLELTDLLTDPHLIEDQFPTNEFIGYGYKINTAPSRKLLHRLFVNGKNISVEKELTSTAIKPIASVDSIRMYLGKGRGEALIKSMEAKLVPIEKASLGIIQQPFRIGELETEWVLTNAAPAQEISFTASITSGADLFEVSPASGTFTDRMTITLRCKEASDVYGIDTGYIKIDAGDAGVMTRKFIRPRGSDRKGYLLYSENVSDCVGQLLDEVDSSWSQKEKLSIAAMSEGNSSFIRLGRSVSSTLPSGDQGAFLFIGVPEGHSTNLNFHVSCKLRFFDDYSGYLYLTQNEDQRQFQSAFSSINNGGQKQVKLTLTDYTRNTGLFTKNAPRNEWISYDFVLNLLPSYKKLEEVTFYNMTKVEGYKITGTKVQPSDAVDFLRLNLTYNNAYVDIKDLKVSLDPPVPEPALAALALMLGFFAFRKNR